MDELVAFKRGYIKRDKASEVMYALRHIKSLSVYEMMASIKDLDYPSLQGWGRFKSSIIKSFREKIRNKSTFMHTLKTDIGKQAYFKFKKAQKISDIYEAFDWIRSLDSKKESLGKLILNFSENSKENVPMKNYSIDELTEVISVSEHFETLLEEIITSIPLNDQMDQELDRIEKLAMYRLVGDITSTLQAGLHSIGNPIEVFNMAVGWLASVLGKNIDYSAINNAIENSPVVEVIDE